MYLSVMMFFEHCFRHEQNQHPEEVTNAGIEANVHGNDQLTDADVAGQEDFVHNYHCALMTFGLLMIFFSDSVKEGVSTSLLKFLKVALLILRSYGRVKYAYVVLLFLAKIHAILTEKLAFEAVQNRFFNKSGKAGGNVPLDVRMEHLNKLLKIALKQLASNITEASAQRIAKSLSTLEKVLSMIDKDCNLGPRSGYDSSKNLDETLVTITKDLNDMNAGLEITVGHRTLSDQILKMSGQFHIMIGHDVLTFHQHHIIVSQ